MATTQTRERPILFSGSMVRAIIEGRKTQTRRVVKPQPEAGTDCPYHVGSGTNRVARACPYGRVGDRLWVRESLVCDTDKGWCYAATMTPIQGPVDEMEAWMSLRRVRQNHVPSIHMPRWASRLTLDVRSVRVERVQEINEEDIRAEGITPDDWRHLLEDFPRNECPRLSFESLWDSINGKGAWARNDWVWVLEFKRTDTPPRAEE